jgi:hypothetical protein
MLETEEFPCLNRRVPFLSSRLVTDTGAKVCFSWRENARASSGRPAELCMLLSVGCHPAANQSQGIGPDLSPNMMVVTMVNRTALGACAFLRSPLLEYTVMRATRVPHTLCSAVVSSSLTS